MEEIWKQYVTRFTNIEISNLGNVKGTKYNGKPFTEDLISINNKGRKCVGSAPIFHLVWLVFNGKKPSGYDIHHIDGNKLNDRLDNLQLIDHGEHSRHHNIGKELTDETKQKIKDKRALQVFSDETLKKKSESMKGENNPFYGKHHTKEVRTKISEKLKGKMSGEKNPFYGKHHTKETKQKISKSRTKNNS